MHLHPVNCLRAILISTAVFSCSSFAHGQEKTVRGKVTDAETREPLAGVHIIAFGKSLSGNTTNTEGEFILQLHGPTDSVRFSFIGFKSKILLGKDLNGEILSIALMPHATQLNEITVRSPSPTDIISEAVKAIPLNYEQHPFQLRGFYREQIRNGKTFYSVAEAVFESQFFPGKKGEDQPRLRLVQGRRSETVKSSRIFEDYHPSGGPNYLTENLLEARLPPFMMSENFSDYTYAIDSITSYDGHDVYLIAFDQRPDIQENLWKGKIYIEADSKAILEIASALSPRGLAYRKHLSGKDKVLAGLLGIDFKLLDKKSRFSYHRLGNTWSLHEATLNMDIAFKQPRKNIDEQINIAAELLAISQSSDNFIPIDKDDQWRKNQLVLNLPGEFDEGFWGADNYIKPETALAAVVASMKTVREKSLATGLQSGWQFYREDLAKAYDKDSTILLKPYVESRWKDESRGPFLWKWQEGNFDFSSRVKVTRTSDPSLPPDKGFQVGAIMARDGGSESEAHVLLALGCMGNEKLKIVAQNTTGGNSATQVTKVDANDFLLRMTRKGSEISLYFLNTSKGQWELVRTVSRGDLPARLQVGLAGYSWFPGDAPNRKPDLLIHFGHPTIGGK